MTVETQTFVGVGDFVGLRFTCRNCGGKTTVSLSSDSKFLSYPQGLSCPHCPQPWFDGPNDKRLEAPTVFLDRLAQLRTTKLPFELQMEIATRGE